MTIKWFKPPFNCVIFPLTKPQVANQQKKMCPKMTKTITAWEDKITRSLTLLGNQIWVLLRFVCVCSMVH